MIQAVLCQRPEVANSLSGVALLGTMLGSDFAASSCQQKLPRSLPLLWAHGVQDPVLPYQPGSSMGVKALGAGLCAQCQQLCITACRIAWVVDMLDSLK